MRALRFLVAVSLTVAAFALVTTGCGRGEVQTYPSKPIDLVIHTDPGGGSDIYGRMVGDIVEKEKLSSQPINFVNKGGGSGAVAASYMYEKKGDDYTILSYAGVVLSTLLADKVPGHSYKELTPIALLQLDPNIIQVRADSKYKTVKELIDDAKARPKQVSIGFGSIGSSDHMIAFMIGKATGAEFNYLSFKSGGEAATQMLGGHVDFSMGQPGEAAGQLAAGKIRLLAASTDERLPMFKEVPTLKESGIPVSFKLMRGIAGPPGMSKEAVTYLEGVFKKVSENQRYKDYVSGEGSVLSYKNSADFAKFLDEWGAELLPIVKDMKL